MRRIPWLVALIVLAMAAPASASVRARVIKVTVLQTGRPVVDLPRSTPLTFALTYRVAGVPRGRTVALRVVLTGPDATLILRPRAPLPARNGTWLLTFAGRIPAASFRPGGYRLSGQIALRRGQVVIRRHARGRDARVV